MSKEFDIPVVIIFFRRPEKTVKILEKISQVQPRKIYLISDEGRSDAERCEVAKTREAVEAAITWNCVVVKDYATENKGVYDRIGLGALRVFQKEKWAIFLEDDNMPEVSFFTYCKEMLERYEYNQRILWVCGTNYLEKCSFESGADYGFTQHMLPCGWASWGDKFTKYYDGNFELLNRKTVRKLRSSYSNHGLFSQDKRNWLNEIKSYQRTNRYISWDYHMGFSLRVHNMFGIVPRYNQIVNIGVDEVSEHGGYSMNNEMTTRLCSMRSYALSFPLKHPKAVEIDSRIEQQLADIITWPFLLRLKSTNLLSFVIKRIRKILGVPENLGFKEYFHTIINGQSADKQPF